MPERRPTVLLVVEQLRRRVPGGIGVHAQGLLGGLAQCSSPGEGAEVTLLASRPGGFRPGTAHPAEDPLARFGRPVLVSRLPGPLVTRAWDHGVCHAPRGFDVVHSVTLAAPRPWRASGSRLVVTVHDLAWRRCPEATTRRGLRWHEAALGRVRDSAASVVVPSRLVAADLQSFGVDAGRITVVPGGADHLPDPDAAATDALLGRLAVRGEFLLSVATLEPRKNVDRLVRAFARVRSSLPGPWTLLVVGPTGWGPGPQHPHDTDGVVFAGSVPDPVLAELYRRARALAYVPLTEGYGLPPLEAMRFGTPVVASDEVPSVHDLGAVEPAPAVIVDPLQVEGIAAGLHAVLTDDALRAELAVRGREHARGRSWRAAANAHLSLWRSLR
ncbi:MAG: glycosyltransferase family 4 protein [Acidimicrobiales bacterium]